MTTSVFVNDVRVPEGHRSPKSHTVKTLAGSFKDIGHQTPITFYWDGETPVLIAGRQRLEAARSLGWEHIDAVEMDVDPLTQELWTIDENLARNELTAVERADHTSRRAIIVKERAVSAKTAETNIDPSKNADRGQAAFIAETARLTGRSERSVEVDKRRGEKITPETMKAIKDTPAADSGVELDAIADLEPNEQMQAVKWVKSGASKDFRTAKDFIKGEEPTAVDAEYMRQEKSLRRLGPMVKTPEGKTVEQVCREGMAMKAGGMKIAEVAKDLGMSVVTYRSARDIIRLADKRELSKRDKATVTVALSEMNGLNQVAMPHEAVMPIVERVWGKGSKRKSEKSRLRTFDQAYGILSQWLMLASEIEVPYLSSERVTEILAELKEGQKCLRKFEQRISEIHR